MVELVKGECSLCAGVEVIDEELVLGSWSTGGNAASVDLTIDGESTVLVACCAG